MQVEGRPRSNGPTGPHQGHNAHNARARYEQILAENAELKKRVQQERGMRQYYAKKLEDAEEEWLEQVEQLQSYVKSIRNTMRDMSQAPDIVRENRSSSDSGGRKSPNHMNGAAPERPGSSPSSYHKHDRRHQVVREIKGVFEAKASVLEDDVAFIREVKEGISLAPEMDPERELQELIKKFKTWKSDFKEKLKSTSESLKKLNKEASPPQGKNSRGTPQPKRGQSPGSLASLDTGGTESGSQGSGKKDKNKSKPGVVRRFLSLGRTSQ